MKNKAIVTKFGTAKVQKDGYYHITSGKEGNNNKLLHRLIFADYWQIDDINEFFGEKMHIHHIDGNKLNNELNNLEPIPEAEHHSLHNKGENNPNYGKRGEETSMYGKKQSEETRIQISKNQNTSGYFNVTIVKRSDCKQGFYYRYSYYDENGERKSINSVDIKKLEQRVRAKGLLWKKYDKEEEQ